MIEGSVNPAYEAIIPLRLYGANGQAFDVSAVVDTGFNEFLTLPPQLVAELELPFAYFGQAILADDTEADFDVHHVTVSWDGQPRDVEVGAMGGTPLVGMLLLDRHTLTIDVEAGGRVAIQAKA